MTFSTKSFIVYRNEIIINKFIYSITPQNMNNLTFNKVIKISTHVYFQFHKISNFYNKTLFNQFEY